MTDTNGTHHMDAVAGSPVMAPAENTFARLWITSFALALLALATVRAPASPAQPVLGEVSEGAAEAPSDEEIGGTAT